MSFLSALFKTRPSCPNCGGKLKAMPQRKTKCPHCGKYIYSRKGGIFGRKILISEQMVAKIEKQQEEEIRRSILQSQLREREGLKKQRDIFPFVAITGFAVTGELCPICSSHKDKIYPAKEAQMPPFDKCTCDGGCRCLGIRLMESDLAEYKRST